MSIRAIHPFVIRRFFPMCVTCCPSGMQYTTMFRSRYRNNTLFYSELNGVHAAAGFIALRLIVFEIGVYKIDK